MSRSGAVVFECVTERSGYPLAGKSRIVTKRISAATNVADYCGADISRTFLHDAVYLTPSSKPHKTAAFPHGAPYQ